MQNNQISHTEEGPNFVNFFPSKFATPSVKNRGYTVNVGSQICNNATIFVEMFML